MPVTQSLASPAQIEQALKQVRDQSSFIQKLLIDTLHWPIHENVERIEDISYGWTPDELRAEGLDKHLLEGRISQLQLKSNQPWGIFLLEFKSPDAFVTGRGIVGPLRKVLRGLVPSRRKAADAKSWQKENLLFLCTHNYQHFRVGYFKAPVDRKRAAPLAAFGWGPDIPARTACEFNLPPLTWPEETTAEAWVTQWALAFDVEKVTKRFYQELANWYFWALGRVQFPKDAPKDADGRDSLSLIRLITRVIFCWFIKEKGLIPETLFNAGEAQSLLADKSDDASTYYQAILQNLFFATLNQEMGQREFRKTGQHFMAHNLYRYRKMLKDPEGALRLFASIPFMNGGLFECLDKHLGTKEKPKYIRIDGFSDRDDNLLSIPNELFFGKEQTVDLSEAYGEAKYRSAEVRGLIHTLNRYRFTIAENTPLEQEVALDPELLGKVFENLLAAFNPETGATARKQTGSFYTPRAIVDYMVDESLIASLKAKLEVSPQFSASAGRGDAGLDADLESRLRHLFTWNDEPHQFAPAEVEKLIESIDHLKILDPACGSGAFPMGILHKLVFVIGKLDPHNVRWKARQVAKAEEIPDHTVREAVVADIKQAFEANELDYGRKLYLIENCIYGVDIQPIAVQISKLRCFISLVVDQKKNAEAENLGIVPLPNLETNFVAANTLIAVERPGQKTLRNVQIDAKESELRRVRDRHFSARTPATKFKCREEDAKLRNDLAALLEEEGWGHATAKQLASWDPYDQNASGSFFDPEWMFGITTGFDVLIGNPPYIRLAAVKSASAETAKYLKSNYVCASKGDFDLYSVFMERSVCLAKNGVVSLIVPTGWYSGPMYSALRRFMAENTNPLVFVNLPYDMFEHAWVDTTVFVAERRPQPRSWPPTARCDVRLKNFSKKHRLTDATDFTEGEEIVDIAEWFADGGDEYLTHANSTLTAVIRKIRSGASALGECADVQRGVTPFHLAEKPTHTTSIRAFAGTVRRYTFETGPMRFVRFDDTLAEPKPQRYFVGPRILLRELISRQFQLQATKVTADFVTNKSMQSILPIPNGPHINFLLGCLNSRLMSWFFLRQSNVAQRDDFPKIVLKETRNLPIPKVDLTNADASARYNRVINLVGEILELKNQDLTADTGALENEIDDAVFKLYGLSSADIKDINDSILKPTSISRLSPAAPPFA